jgi:DNA-directed RNA polymerase subunit RPC12/RpoP
MSPGFSKCVCGHCGGHVEFPDDSAGSTVACPHCAGEIILTAESESGPVKRSPQGKKAVVLGAMVVLVAASAAGIYLARMRAGPSSAVPTESRRRTELSTPDVPVREPDIHVVPVLARYQSGLGAKDIRKGREIYANRCSECHRFFDPASYAEEEWQNIIGKMRGKAKLNPNEAGEVDRFIRSIRSAQ